MTEKLTKRSNPKNKTLPGDCSVGRRNAMGRRKLNPVFSVELNVYLARRRFQLRLATVVKWILLLSGLCARLIDLIHHRAGP